MTKFVEIDTKQDIKNYIKDFELEIETETNKLTIDKSKNNYIKLNIEYNINILDLFKGKNEINILIEYNI